MRRAKSALFALWMSRNDNPLVRAVPTMAQPRRARQYERSGRCLETPSDGSRFGGER
jgi:hypothetical protein